MDPRLQFQQNMNRDFIQEEIGRLLALDGPERQAELANMRNRAQGIPEPVQRIREHAFPVPEHSLAEILQRPAYRRARIGKHFKRENGKDFYNANLAALQYESPDRIAGDARAQATRQPNPPDDAQLNRIYHQARQAQLNANHQADLEAPQWTLCQRSCPNDTTQEDMAIRYTPKDHGHKELDWHATILNLRDLGEQLGYTLDHYNKAMNRWVTYYKPSLSPLITDMDANQTARFLMSLNTPKPRRQQNLQALKILCRQVGTDLRTIMSELNQRAEGYYADEPAENRQHLIDNMMLTGIMRFTTGNTNKAIQQTITQYQLENRRPNPTTFLEQAIQAEEAEGPPTIPLPFWPTSLTPCLFNSSVNLFNSLVQPMVQPLVNQHPQLIAPLVHAIPNNTAHHIDANQIGYNQPQNQYYGQTMGALAPGPQNHYYGGAYPPFYQPQAPVQPPVAQPPHQPALAVQQPMAQVQVQPPVQREEIVPPNLPEQDGAMALPHIIYNENAQDWDPEIAFAIRGINAQEITPVNPQHPPAPPVQRDPYPKRDRDKVKKNLYNYSTQAVMPGQTSNTDSKVNQVLEGLEKLLTRVTVNAALPSVNQAPPTAEPKIYQRGTTPNREQRYRSPSPYRPDQRNNRDQYDRSRPQYRNNYDNRYSNRPASGDNRSRYRTPPRDGRNSPGPYNRQPDRRESNRPPYTGYQQNGYSRDGSYRPNSRSPSYQPTSSRSPYRQPSPGGNYRQNTRYETRQNSPRRPDMKQLEYKPDNNQRNRPRSPSPYKPNDTTHRNNSSTTSPILRGVNCNPNYTESQGLLCSKCSTYGKHKEHECPTYYNWAPNPCRICNLGLHMTNDCIKKRDPTPDRTSPKPNRQYNVTKN